MSLSNDNTLFGVVLRSSEMKNLQIAQIFDNIADLLEIQGANQFRVRAYRNAKASLEKLTDTVEEIAKRGGLREISGIGKDLSGKIIEYIETGRIQAFEDLKTEIPVGLVNIVSIPTIGPKTAKAIFDHFGVKSVEALEKLTKSQDLLAVPGIKEKTIENIANGIALLKRRQGMFLIGRVFPVARKICDDLGDVAHRVTYAGSLRRMKESVHDIDILASSTTAEATVSRFLEITNPVKIIVKGPTKTSVLLTGDLQVDLRVVKPENWGAALNYFTGSKAHNIKLRERAIKFGLKLNEYGLFNSKEKSITTLEEEDIYNALDLPFIPPVLREDNGEIEAAAAGKLPELIQVKDIRGDLHMHTTWSDGAASTQEMVEAAIARGYDYVAITDHSKSLGVAGGLSDEQLLDHIREIKELDDRTPHFRVLSGTEVDIRGDGTLDYSDEILSKLDFVVASIHSGFRQDRETLTQRIVRAMRNPHVRVIGHPTGRLLGDRDPYDVDFDEIMKEAARTHTCLEVNAHYYRLDLNDVLCRKARENNVQLIISTDSHNFENLENLLYGVGTAQRGWLEKEHVLNSGGVEDLLAYKKGWAASC